MSEPYSAVLADALAAAAARHRRAAAAAKALDDATMAVALAQPHRQGSSDRRLENALGRLKLPDNLFRAGRRYASVSLDFKRAIDAFERRRKSGGRPQTKSEVSRDLRARARYEAAVDALLAADPDCHALIERVCVDEREPHPGEDELLVKGLNALAKHLRPQPP
jgi:hypothetical protein